MEAQRHPRPLPIPQCECVHYIPDAQFPTRVTKPESHHKSLNPLIGRMQYKGKR